MRGRHASRLKLTSDTKLSSDSLGNPFVHSLSVTLSNHAVCDARTYNWPCPVGHLPILQVSFRFVPGFTLCGGFYIKILRGRQNLELVLYGVVRL